jgi:Leucine-rich repeat (LRR) protein
MKALRLFRLIAVFSLICASLGMPNNVRAQTFDCSNVTDIPPAECEALVALYNSTDGANWTNHTNWLETNTPCSWYGLSCVYGATTNINGIALGFNQLTGSIPLEIGNFPYLQNLFLGGNPLTGSIPPQLGQLANLKLLGLGSNEHTGPIPVELAALTYLENLNLSDNQLTGTIPLELGDMTSLNWLSLGANQFSGGFPTQLTNLTNLQNLNISSANLSGPIPDEIGQLTSLTLLDLSNNDFSGVIPATLGELTLLENLWLNQNNFSGEIPASIANLTNLRILHLDNNEQIIGEFPSSIRSLTNLHTLHLHHTQTSGSIPSWINELTHLRGLHLENNQLTGSIPVELTMLSNLETLNISINKLTGPIPAQFANMISLQRAYLGGNQFSGGFPTQLTKLPALVVLHLYDSGLSGTLPVELGDFPVITSLDLSNNDFSGPVPNEIGNLTSLEQLWLGHNSFSGEIPASITNLINLHTVDVCGLGSTDPVVIAFLDGINPDWRCSHAPALPRMYVMVAEDRIPTEYWPAGATLFLSVDSNTNPDDGDLYHTTQATELMDGGPQYGATNFRLWQVFDLVPGQYVSITDGTTVKSTQIVSGTFDQANTATSVATGSGPAGARVALDIKTNTGRHRMDVTIDANGNWLADFAANGMGFQNIQWGTIDIWDEDGDSSVYCLQFPLSFGARPATDTIEGWEWPAGSSIEVRVNDPTTPLVDPDYTATGSPDWVTGDHGHTLFTIELIGYDLKFNDTVTVTDGTTTRVHIVRNLILDEVDLVADTVSGAADLGQLVNPLVCLSRACAYREVTPGPNGRWIADFSIAGDRDFEQDILDVRPGAWVDSTIRDEDGDVTQAGMYLPDLNFNVRPNVDQVEAFQWAMGDNLVVEIDDPDTLESPDYTVSKNVTDIADWDPSQTPETLCV